MSIIETPAATPLKPKKLRRSKRRESWRQYAQRRGVSTRTLDRWVVDGILPAPDYINGRKYIDPDTEPRTDAA
jgi:hypothetical protein